VRSDHSAEKNFIDHPTTMKSPSQTQSINTSTHPITLSNSFLQALPSSNVESLVFPTTMTNTTPPESEAVQQRIRLHMILDSAIAVIDDEDLCPTESSTTHQCPLQ
jgi:hypothetical protein